jgi:hypothetical protein
MTGLIRAEVLRLRTVRTYWLLAASAIALIAGVVALTTAATSFKHGASLPRSPLVIAGLAQTVALIAGVLSVTGEFRHQTIIPAVLITPPGPTAGRQAHHPGCRRAGFRPGRNRGGCRQHAAPAGRPAHPRRGLRHRRRSHRWRHHRRARLPATVPATTPRPRPGRHPRPPARPPAGTPGQLAKPCQYDTKNNTQYIITVRRVFYR